MPFENGFHFTKRSAAHTPTQMQIYELLTMKRILNVPRPVIPDSKILHLRACSIDGLGSGVQKFERRLCPVTNEVMIDANEELPIEHKTFQSKNHRTKNKDVAAGNCKSDMKDLGAKVVSVTVKSHWKMYFKLRFMIRAAVLDKSFIESLRR